MNEHSNPKDLIIVDENSGVVSRWLPAVVVFAVVSGFVGLAWYAYHAGMQSLKNDDLLVVEPDKTPVKIKPESPGGMQFPGQDKTIFDTFGGPPPEPKVERVLPPPEQPAAMPPAGNAGTVVTASKAPSTTTPEQIIPPAPVEPKAAPAVTAKKAVPPVSHEAPTVAPPVSQQMPVIALPTREETPVVATKPEAKPHPAPEKKPAAIAFPAENVTIAGPQVQLGAYRSEQEAGDAWKAMQKKHPQLAGKEPVILKADLGKRGVYYRLRLGGFASRNAAKAFCQKLSASHQPCILPVH